MVAIRCFQGLQVAMTSELVLQIGLGQRLRYVWQVVG